MFVTSEVKARDEEIKKEKLTREDGVGIYNFGVAFNYEVKRCTIIDLCD